MSWMPLIVRGPWSPTATPSLVAPKDPKHPCAHPCLEDTILYSGTSGFRPSAECLLLLAILECASLRALPSWASPSHGFISFLQCSPFHPLRLGWVVELQYQFSSSLLLLVRHHHSTSYWPICAVLGPTFFSCTDRQNSCAQKDTACSTFRARLVLSGRITEHNTITCLHLIVQPVPSTLRIHIGGVSLTEPLGFWALSRSLPCPLSHFVHPYLVQVLCRPSTDTLDWSGVGSPRTSRDWQTQLLR